MRSHLSKSIDPRVFSLAFVAAAFAYEETGDDAALHMVVTEVAAHWSSLGDAVRDEMVEFATARRDGPWTSAFAVLLDLVGVSA